MFFLDSNLGKITVNSFKSNLQAHLQDQAILMLGYYDTIVRMIWRIFAAHQITGRERLHLIQEARTEQRAAQTEAGYS